jgi:hypothetical protein
MTSTRTMAIAIIIGLSLLFAAAAVISSGTHAEAATMVEYAL